MAGSNSSAGVAKNLARVSNVYDAGPDGLHVLRRGSSRGAAQLFRQVIAPDARAQTAHELAAEIGRERLPTRVAELLINRRTHPMQTRRAAYRHCGPTTTAPSTPTCFKRREHRRLRRQIARRGPTGSGRQGAPTQRGRPRTRRRRRPGMSGFGLGPAVRQPDSGCSRYAFSQSAQDDFFGVGRTVSIRSLSVAGASLA